MAAATPGSLESLCTVSYDGQSSSRLDMSARALARRICFELAADIGHTVLARVHLSLCYMIV